MKRAVVRVRAAWVKVVRGKRRRTDHSRGGACRRRPAMAARRVHSGHPALAAATP